MASKTVGFVLASVDNFGEMEELNECNQKKRAE